MLDIIMRAVAKSKAKQSAPFTISGRSTLGEFKSTKENALVNACNKDACTSRK
jgi:hypothetical protein